MKRLKIKVKKGSVMMEYVILLGVLVTFMEFIVLATYDFQSSWGSGSFGFLAVPVVHLYQRIVAMISLPFP